MSFVWCCCSPSIETSSLELTYRRLRFFVAFVVLLIACCCAHSVCLTLSSPFATKCRPFRLFVSCICPTCACLVAAFVWPADRIDCSKVYVTLTNMYSQAPALTGSLSPALSSLPCFSLATSTLHWYWLLLRSTNAGMPCCFVAARYRLVYIWV